MVGYRHSQLARLYEKAEVDSASHCNMRGSEDRLCELYEVLPTNLTLIVIADAER
jgi:hypothetical protein